MAGVSDITASSVGNVEEIKAMMDSNASNYDSVDKKKSEIMAQAAKAEALRHARRTTKEGMFYDFYGDLTKKLNEKYPESKASGNYYNSAEEYADYIMSIIDGLVLKDSGTFSVLESKLTKIAILAEENLRDVSVVANDAKTFFHDGAKKVSVESVVRTPVPNPVKEGASDVLCAVKRMSKFLHIKRTEQSSEMYELSKFLDRITDDQLYKLLMNFGRSSDHSCNVFKDMMLNEIKANKSP